jgi:hypothetical protein
MRRNEWRAFLGRAVDRHLLPMPVQLLGCAGVVIYIDDGSLPSLNRSSGPGNCPLYVVSEMIRLVEISIGEFFMCHV